MTHEAWHATASLRCPLTHPVQAPGASPRAQARSPTTQAHSPATYPTKPSWFSPSRPPLAGQSSFLCTQEALGTDLYYGTEHWGL